MILLKYQSVVPVRVWEKMYVPFFLGDTKQKRRQVNYWGSPEFFLRAVCSWKKGVLSKMLGFIFKETKNKQISGPVFTVQLLSTKKKLQLPLCRSPGHTFRPHEHSKLLFDAILCGSQSSRPLPNPLPPPEKPSLKSGPMVPQGGKHLSVFTQPRK